MKTRYLFIVPLALLLGLSACDDVDASGPDNGTGPGSDTAKVEPAVPGGPAGSTQGNQTFVGKWKLDKITFGEETITGDDARAAGNDAPLTIRADGTFSMGFADDTTEGTWTSSSSTTISLTAEGSTIDGKLSNGQLTLSDGDASYGMYLVYVKS